MSDISNQADVLDVRAVIRRVEELREERDGFEPAGMQDETWAANYPEEGAELAELDNLLDDLRGRGGDHLWEGDWYPGTLIRDSYFEEDTRQYAEDIGAISKDMPWPANHIDWPAAARERQQGFGQVDFDGVTYWYRA